jgi:predicted Zn-dependent peptidase
MNRIFLTLISLATLLSLKAQTLSVEDPNKANSTNEYGIELQKIILKNGLTVYLNPDPNMTDVMGAIAVKGGANHDAKDAEGTAHYFEHMMFKGSTNLGTINYEAEKVYLDSIREAYDLLALSKGDEVFRNGILKNINRLSQKASEYAIPNEFSKVLSSIGGSQINAYTTYENIVYHNHFPAESMEQWIMLQVDRFESPVFRLFQSELETVYEEKNMSMDNSFQGIYQELYKSFYPNSVYGKQTVLGSVESLKTPSISKMETYFKDYYIASNMALILVGNFDVEQVKEMLEGTFGTWRDGGFQEVAKASEPAIEGRVVVKKKLSPIPLGILGFRTVEKGHKDELVLEIINELLSNDESTGLLDELTVNNELMYVTAISDVHYDIGGSFIAFVPKPFVQSIKSGEKKILEQLEKLKNGDFDEQLLKAIVTKKRKEFIMGLESADNRAQLILEAFMTNQDVNKLIAENDHLKDIDKARIQEIARKYYGDNYLAFLSKMGFPKNTKLDKPNISPLKPINRNANSVLAEQIYAVEGMEPEPNYINFNQDVRSSDVFENLHFYYAQNPMNKIYSIDIQIGIGSYSKPELVVVADYLNLVGTKKNHFNVFRTRLQGQGASIYCDVDKSNFTIHMTGFDYSLSQDLEALKELLTQTEVNETTLKKVVKDYSMDYKMLKSDISTQSRVLHNYAVYGSQSPYLTRMGMSDMKKLKPADIMTAIHDLFGYESDIYYTGTMEEQTAKSLIKQMDLFHIGLKKSSSPVYLTLPTLSNDVIYFMNNKKAVQSHIRLTTPSKIADADNRAYINAFNKYFGIGMSSVMFREVREYRSLAYGVYAYMAKPQRFSDPIYLNAAMTTQGDKTNEAIRVFTNLIDTMPQESETIDNLKKSLLFSFNSQITSFRQKNAVVAYWIKQGYTEDPRKVQVDLVTTLTMDQINHFYDEYVKERKHCISLVGDKNRFDLEGLKKEGSITEVKLKKIYKK